MITYREIEYTAICAMEEILKDFPDEELFTIAGQTLFAVRAKNGGIVSATIGYIVNKHKNTCKAFGVEGFIVDGRWKEKLLVDFRDALQNPQRVKGVDFNGGDLGLPIWMENKID